MSTVSTVTWGIGVCWQVLELMCFITYPIIIHIQTYTAQTYTALTIASLCENTISSFKCHKPDGKEGLQRVSASGPELASLLTTDAIHDCTSNHVSHCSIPINSIYRLLDFALFYFSVKGSRH